MKKIRNFTLIVTALFMVLGGVALADNYADHVKVAPNGKGDVLVFPFYGAFDNYETEIVVVNTSKTMSCVAKVVVLSQKNTQEVLDFFIYLSPTDVWTGVLRMGTGSNAGKAVMASDDDSMLIGMNGATPTFASPGTTFEIALGTPPCSDTNQFGYVNVFESRMINLGLPRVAKAKIFQAYWDTPNVTVSQTGLLMPGNILAGNMKFVNAGLNLSSALDATVLRDYDVSTPLAIGKLTELGALNGNNAMIETEACLSKNDLAMPYTSKIGTYHVITFPTKLTRINTTSCKPLAVPYGSEYFNVFANSNGSLEYTYNDYDLTELTVVGTNPYFSPTPDVPGAFLPGEMNYRNDFAFNEGWTRYEFPPSIGSNAATRTIGEVADSSHNISFTGTPVIGSIVDVGSNGYMHYGASTPGSVSAHFLVDTDNDPQTAPVNVDRLLPYYQYADYSCVLP